MRRLIDNGNRPITPKPHIGHYGRLRKAYLEQYRHRLYTALVASEKLYPHLAETDRAARDIPAAATVCGQFGTRRGAFDLRECDPAL